MADDPRHLDQDRIQIVRTDDGGWAFQRISATGAAVSGQVGFSSAIKALNGAKESEPDLFVDLPSPGS